MTDYSLYTLFELIGHFSSGLYRQHGKPPNNEFLSSFSTHVVLTLISQDPWFRKDFLKEVVVIDLTLATNYYKEIFTALKGAEGLDFANASFFNHQGQMPELFKNRIRDNFASEVNLLDFTRPEDAIATINAWFCEKRAQKIPPIICLRDDVRFAFLNATRFKGSWLQTFSAEETVPGVFHVDKENTIEVQMMRRKGEFYFSNYTYALFFHSQVLKLPLAGSTANLVVVLPYEDFDIDVLVEKISRICSYPSPGLIWGMKKKEVDVSLPKFKINWSMELAQLLRKV